MKFDRSIQQVYGRDDDLEKNGVPVDFYLLATDKITIYVARAGTGNDRYQQEIAKKIYGLQGVVSFDNLPAEQRRRIWQEIYADSIIKDWEGVRDEEGNPVPFNRENVLEFLGTFDEIWERIFSVSRDFSNFKSKVDAVVKNS
jgi:hypothetical protein